MASVIHASQCDRMFRGGGSTQLARVFGIRIGASPGWFLFLFLMIWWLSARFSRRAARRERHHHLRDGRRRRAAVLPLDRAARARPRGRRAAQRHRGPRASTCGSSAAWRSSRATRESPGEEFRIAAAGPSVTLVLTVIGVVAVAIFSHARPGRQPGGRRRRQLAGAGARRVAGARQLRAVGLQPRARLPARRRPDRALDRLEGDRRPQPRHALRRPPRPGLRLHLDRLRRLPAGDGDAADGHLARRSSAGSCRRARAARSCPRSSPSGSRA